MGGEKFYFFFLFFPCATSNDEHFAMAVATAAVAANVDDVVI